MSDISEALRAELRDPAYSEGYAESFLNSYIATQIKVIREQRNLRQAELAALMGTTQTAISRIENVNYSAWNIKTLKKLARALRVRLRVSFETFGTLPDEVEAFDRESLQRDAREDDPGLREPVLQEEHNEFVAQALNPGAANNRPSPRRDNIIVMPLRNMGDEKQQRPQFSFAAQRGISNDPQRDLAI